MLEDLVNRGAVSVAEACFLPTNAEYDTQHNPVPQKSMPRCKASTGGYKVFSAQRGPSDSRCHFLVATICLKAEAALVVQKPMII